MNAVRLAHYTVLAVLGSLLCRTGLSAAQGARKTVWDGVYTGAQAERGAQEYKKSCGHCHRDDLTGGGSEAGAPALKGPIFTFRWNDQPLSELFLTIGTTMPQNKPDTLTPDAVVDIMSFLLQSNDFPSGQSDLEPRVEPLKAIWMVERPK
jgi:mono/diheme cytochrome c family protein